jgi:hypothetical protein
MHAHGELLSAMFNHVALDSWVIMPNHMHGIIVIQDAYAGADRPVGAVHEPPLFAGCHGEIYITW